MFTFTNRRHRKLTVETLEDRALLTAYLVNTLDDQLLAGAGDTDGMISLREAIQAANDNTVFGDAPAGQGGGAVDTISFADALANQTILLGGQQLTISDDLALKGLGANRLTLSGNEASRIFSVDSGVAASISHVTITGGAASTGGAVYNEGSLEVRSTVMTDNSARLWGGAIANWGGMLTVAASTISNNESRFYGGAIDNSARGTVKIAGSTLSGNSTGSEGGAIENYFSTLEITNSTLSGNSSKTVGGGIWNLGALNVTNSTLTSNRADANGNGSGRGGGLYLASSSRFPAAVLNNTIVAGNLRGIAGSDGPDDSFGTVDLASAHNLIGDPSTSGGLTDGSSGNIVGDGGTIALDITTVLDTRLAANGGSTLTHALVAGSPAIDSGDNSKALDADGNPLPFDQRGDGFDRLVSGVVDIGAFEVPPPPLPIEVDVKPGSVPNSINLANQGLVAVSILTTDDFDAADVNVSTVVWAGANVAQRDDRSYFSTLEDVDGDGDLDLVLHFRLADTDLLDIYEDLLCDDLADGTLDSHRQSVDIALEGLTNDGDAFRGSDAVELFLTGKILADFRDQRGI